MFDRMTEIRYALSLPNLAEPAELLAVGLAAERTGWDGVFLWDHLYAGAQLPVPMSDSWVVLGALAARTERIRLGTAVTPLPRRRPQKVAREAVTVDHLSNGRMVLGVGLGQPPDEYAAFEEPADPHTLSARLDEALDVVTGLWSGKHFDHHGPYFAVNDAQFLPVPVQQPRIPIWTACVKQTRGTVARAARWDGVVLAEITDDGDIQTISLDRIDAAIREIAEHRRGQERFDVAVISRGMPDEPALSSYLERGVTWILVTGWMKELRDLAEAQPKS